VCVCWGGEHAHSLPSYAGGVWATPRTHQPLTTGWVLHNGAQLPTNTGTTTHTTPNHITRMKPIHAHHEGGTRAAPRTQPSRRAARTQCPPLQRPSTARRGRIATLATARWTCTQVRRACACACVCACMCVCVCAEYEERQRPSLVCGGVVCACMEQHAPMAAHHSPHSTLRLQNF